MRLHLPAHVHAASIGDDLVFLDTAGDLYLCVPGGAAALRPDPAARAFSPVSEAAAREVMDAGLVVEAATAARHPPPPARPRASLAEDLPDRPCAADILRLLLALADVPLGYGGRRFEKVMEAAVRGRPGSPRPHTETLRLAAVFRRLSIWLPLSGKCLVRSFVLLRFLHRSGCSAQWVVGVRTWPFGAHCWLQSDDVALDDAAERLETYEPILAVGG